MTISSFTIDATAVGTTIGPVDGFIINFKQVDPPYTVLGGPGYGRTQGIFQSGLIHIQGTNDPRPWMYLDANDQAPITVGGVSQKYLGQLQILAVPFGASYTLDLSDVFV